MAWFKPDICENVSEKIGLKENRLSKYFFEGSYIKNYVVRFKIIKRRGVCRG
jgi:hypothetical protein